MTKDVNRKILGSIDARFLGDKLTSFSAAYFSNFPIDSIIDTIKSVEGVNRVIDYETSYHIEVLFNTNIDCKHKLSVVNNLFNEVYNIAPQYI